MVIWNRLVLKRYRTGREACDACDCGVTKHHIRGLLLGCRRKLNLIVSVGSLLPPSAITIVTFEHIIYHLFGVLHSIHSLSFACNGSR